MWQLRKHGQNTICTDTLWGNAAVPMTLWGSHKHLHRLLMMFLKQSWTIETANNARCLFNSSLTYCKGSCQWYSYCCFSFFLFICHREPKPPLLSAFSRSPGRSYCCQTSRKSKFGNHQLTVVYVALRAVSVWVVLPGAHPGVSPQSNNMQKSIN